MGNSREYAALGGTRVAAWAGVGLICSLFGCQRAKSDDVTIFNGRPTPAPANGGEPGTPISEVDAGAASAADVPRPETIAGKPPEPGVVGGEPVVSPDAGRPLPADPTALAAAFPIVFRSDRSAEGTTDLYLMHTDGSEPQRITRGGDFLLPRWSPDGSQIVFRRIVESGTFSADVGLTSPDGSQVAMLTSGENQFLFQLPANWSPDGRSIVYGSVVPNDGLWLFRMAPSGGEKERLLAGVPAYQREGAWSPVASSRLAYIEADATGLASALLVTDLANPTEAVDLSAGNFALPLEPRWSPDGRRIAVAGFALNPDGSIAGLGGASADAGVVQHSANLDLFLVDVETRQVTQLTDNPKDDYEPTWSPDGSQLLFTSDRDGDEDLWLMPVADPTQARNLIDDNLARHQDGGSDWHPPSP